MDHEILQEAEEARCHGRREAMDRLKLTKKKYGVIYADPPWAYRAYSKKRKWEIGGKPLSYDGHR